jgi:tRNA-2-methylthio-N6-dimethylallyladenosine synthase
MNERDSEIITEILKRKGYKLVKSYKQADIIIVNTCSVRQHAEDKVWSQLGVYEDKIIGVVGCMAQNYKEKIFERAENVSFVVGPQDIDKIPEIIRKVQVARGKSQGKALYEIRIWETDSENRPDEIYHTEFCSSKNHAFVIISEGCSNYCAYCVVPYVRGALRHRTHENILKEINQAVKNGITSITLLGQNVNSYKSGHMDFTGLLSRINAIKGLKEFEFMTSHPKDTNIKLFQAIRRLEKLKKQLHLPLQSGSNKILKKMNRGYTREGFMGLVKDYRKIVPGGLLSTDIIVGFPGESEVDFKHTLELVKAVRFNAAYLFKYSPRPNTAAEKLPDDVTREAKESRHKKLLDLQKKVCAGLAKKR